MLASEQRCLNHFGADDDVEALVIAATESPLHRSCREHMRGKVEVINPPPGTVLRSPGGHVVAVR